MIRAVFADGTVKCYGNPFANNFKKLWDCVEAIKSGTRPICTAETATAHTHLIRMVNEMIPIVDFPTETVQMNGDYVYVDGLYERMYRAYDKECLLSEAELEGSGAV